MMSPWSRMRALGGNEGLVVVRDGDDADLANGGELANGTALEHRRHVGANEAHVAGTDAGDVIELVEGQELADAPHAPVGGRDALDAEPAVRLGIADLVQARDDARDAIGLSGDAGDDDVRLVRSGAGDDGARTIDAGGSEDLTVESDARDGLAANVGPSALSRSGSWSMAQTS